MNCPAMPPGGGIGMKFRKPFRPNTRKITPARYRAIADTVLIKVLLSVTAAEQVVNHLDVNIVDGIYFCRIQVFYGPRHSGRRSRLACNDQGDACADALRGGRY